MSMGRTGVCERNLWSLQNNPSGIAMLSGWQLGGYYENAWLLKETSHKSLGALMAFDKIGVVGIDVVHFGGSTYSESLFGIAYARGFGPYLQLGIQGQAMLFHWGEGYPNRWAFSFALGAQSQVTETLRLGCCLINPIHGRLNTINNDPLPIVMRFGIAYQFTDDFVGQAEIERNHNNEGIRIGGGFEYRLFRQFYLRAGVQHHPDILSFGVGYQVKGIIMDVAAQLHQVLGGSIQVEVRIER